MFEVIGIIAIVYIVLGIFVAVWMTWIGRPGIKSVFREGIFMGLAVIILTIFLWPFPLYVEYGGRQ